MVRKNETKEKDSAVQQCTMEIADIVRGHAQMSVSDATILSAHLLSLAAKYNCPFEVSLETVVSNSDELGIDVSAMVDSCGLHKTWDRLKELTKQYGEDILKSIAENASLSIDKRDEPETPAAISRIAAKLLNIQPTDNVVDLCCGKAGSTLALESACPEAHIWGIEKNSHIAAIGQIRLHAAESHAKLIINDVFADTCEKTCYDKIFSNYPFKVALRMLDHGKEYLEAVTEKIPGIQRATSSDWLFNHLMLDLLKENGSAIGVMTNGSIVNGSEQEIRRYFVENGYVEAIIALPDKLFNSTNIPTAMIVLSRGNQFIRMVDASKQYTAGRRQNIIADNDIQDILNAYYNDTSISKTISIDEIRENEYSLSPSRYFKEKPSLENGVHFEQVIINATRGAHCSAEQLDAMAAHEDTNLYFLKTSDLQDGVISDGLQNLGYIEKNFMKYCLSNGDLLISKTGTPYKIAVADITDDRKILPNANLYILTLDDTKVDPYFLQAFLDSETGQNQLNGITVGTTLPSIGVRDLKSMQIPLPPLSEQKEIASAYKAALDEVCALRKELNAATDRMTKIFETYSK